MLKGKRGFIRGEGSGLTGLEQPTFGFTGPEFFGKGLFISTMVCICQYNPGFQKKIARPVSASKQEINLM